MLKRLKVGQMKSEDRSLPDDVGGGMMRSASHVILQLAARIRCEAGMKRGSWDE